jgi:hypothetical protein
MLNGCGYIALMLTAEQEVLLALTLDVPDYSNSHYRFSLPQNLLFELGALEAKVARYQEEKPRQVHRQTNQEDEPAEGRYNLVRTSYSDDTVRALKEVPEEFHRLLFPSMFSPQPASTPGLTKSEGDDLEQSDTYTLYLGLFSSYFPYLINTYEGALTMLTDLGIPLAAYFTKASHLEGTSYSSIGLIPAIGDRGKGLPEESILTITESSQIPGQDSATLLIGLDGIPGYFTNYVYPRLRDLQQMREALDDYALATPPPRSIKKP